MNPIITEKDDDEWYDRSIVDYSELIMLEIENKPVQLVIDEPNNVFALEEKQPNQQVLSLYQLPDKVVEARRGDVVKSSNLKIKTAAILGASLTQIGALHTQGRVIASQVATPGLRLFELNQDEDKITPSSKAMASSSFEEPRFCLIDRETVILTKTGRDSTYSYNMVGDSLHRLQLEEFSRLFPSASVVPVAISGHSAALAVEETGSIVVYDMRGHSPVTNIPGSGSGAKWWFSTSYEPFPPYKEETTAVTRLSDEGSVAVYDLRHPTKPLIAETLPFMPTGVRMAPSGEFCAISDDRGLVRIFSLSRSQPVEIFCHQGHVRMEHCDRSARITSQLWLSNETLITSADNKTINIWQFNAAS